MKLTVPIFQAEFDALRRFSGILPTGDFPAWVLLVQANNYFLDIVTLNSENVKRHGNSEVFCLE